ncbi:MAG: diacylglycerol kinase family lipid kinase [Chloroflexus sp.]|nr:diacylglycerol kinase family lipid kinase [Chloroflexus sp.]
MATTVILNPAAGRGLAGRRRGAIEAELRKHAIEYELVTTHARGGATELAIQAMNRGVSRIVAVGGDGTINEVVNGIIDSRRGGQVAFGIIPLGTGSDFVKSLPGVRPGDIAGAVQRLANNRLQAIDVGRIRVEAGRLRLNRCFINGLGMGLDAAVAVESLKIKRLRGFAVYLISVFKALATYRPGPMTVRFDGQRVSRQLFFASVGNGRCQGGGFWMTPDAKLDDGLLDLCIVDTMPIPRALRKIPLLMRGTHTNEPEVTMARARRIEVTCPTPIPVATDGEVIATAAQRVEVEVLPRAVQLVV